MPLLRAAPKVVVHPPAPPTPMVNVRAALLDDHAWFAPYAEFWIDEALPWAKTPAKRSYTGFATIEGIPACSRCSRRRERGRGVRKH